MRRTIRRYLALFLSVTLALGTLQGLPVSALPDAGLPAMGDAPPTLEALGLEDDTTALPVLQEDPALREWNGWVFAGHIAFAAALGAVGAHLRYWAKFADLTRLSSKINITQPVIMKIINWTWRGATFTANAIAKGFTRLPGEGWGKFIKRTLAWYL